MFHIVESLHMKINIKFKVEVNNLNEQTIGTIAKHEERLKILEQRIEKNENVTIQIHDLTASVKNLTSEVKIQGSRLEKVITTFEERLEKIIASFDDRMKNMGERIGYIENRGSRKLESIITALVTATLTAAGVYFMRYLGV